MTTRTEEAATFLAAPLAEALPAVPAGFGQLLLPAVSRLPRAQRLVVLVPAMLTSEAALAQHLWTLAQPRGLPVLFVGRVERVQDEPGMRRRLALLAALTRDNDGVRADFQLAVGGDWLGLLGALWRPGDLVVCHTEQSAPLLALGRTFGQAIANGLQTPVYALSGFCAPEGSEVARLGRHLLFWMGALAIVLLFFLVQINVQRLAQDWVQSLVLMLTVIVEFGVLAGWNSWLN